MFKKSNRESDRQANVKDTEKWLEETLATVSATGGRLWSLGSGPAIGFPFSCLLYTSDAADEVY